MWAERGGGGGRRVTGAGERGGVERRGGRWERGGERGWVKLKRGGGTPCDAHAGGGRRWVEGASGTGHLPRETCERVVGGVLVVFRAGSDREDCEQCSWVEGLGLRV